MNDTVRRWRGKLLEERRAVRASAETPRFRRCLAPDHDHEFLTIRAVRICPRGRRQLDVDTRVEMTLGLTRITVAPLGLRAYASESAR
jgi:hypothetical protein